MKISETALFNLSNANLLRTHRTYEKSGKRWKLTEQSAERVDVQYYANDLSFVEMMNDKVIRRNTCAGRIPVKLTSVSPDGMQKAVIEYSITPEE